MSKKRGSEMALLASELVEEACPLVGFELVILTLHPPRAPPVGRCVQSVSPVRPCLKVHVIGLC
jgi:hypothetical protein